MKCRVANYPSWNRVPSYNEYSPREWEKREIPISNGFIWLVSLDFDTFPKTNSSQLKINGVSRLMAFLGCSGSGIFRAFEGMISTGTSIDCCFTRSPDLRVSDVACVSLEQYLHPETGAGWRCWLTIAAHLKDVKTWWKRLWLWHMHSLSTSS